MVFAKNCIVTQDISVDSWGPRWPLLYPGFLYWGMETRRQWGWRLLVLPETGCRRRHRFSSDSHPYTLCVPRWWRGHGCPLSLSMSYLISCTPKPRFLPCSSSQLLEYTNPMLTVLQIPLWLDFGLASQSSWFSCFLCWLCWPRQEPHTKSKSGIFQNTC